MKMLLADIVGLAVCFAIGWYFSDIVDFIREKMK